AFIAAMTKRAALFGIRESSIPSMGIEPLEQKGDLALIGDRPFPASIIRPRAGAGEEGRTYGLCPSHGAGGLQLVQPPLRHPLHGAQGLFRPWPSRTQPP
ncbi:hypothetical protein, partial [Rhizobium sp. P44RR-XXIV]|uniref:hypothetical protein n=1 Tax=Rhizobium sp. P44RR-XXIV TaxID=1921145 RepID=UPI0019818213